MFEIINTLTENDIKEEFVAIGSCIDGEGNAYHSVLIIRYKGESFQFHYTGNPSIGILFENTVYSSCFHKITDTINPRLIPAFIAMCKRVMKTATPRYGYFYSGEYYDNSGNHFSDKEVGETMTCAGFCINILKGFLENDYIYYQDWTSESHPTEGYLDFYCSKYSIDKDKIAESHRRISPIELLCSGFFSNLPIRKVQIDCKIDEVQDYLKNY
ncbi:hypothetical protein [Elizabethkingia anophelis]|uniref:hypothetical protein n=1 Tax=Elizabethkingia anophelis TaxID=1117645 RepID=UPI00063B084A|nr:hypothetical protein [Elizabethkingia anophelis]AKH95402.1 hypothetical protein M876_12580 [Elizabethkingia anophelis FMS-007]